MRPAVRTSLPAPGRAADPAAAGPSHRRAGQSRSLGLLDLIVGDELGVAQHSADVGRPARGAERLLALGEEGRVGGGELLPLRRHVVVVEDRFDRADGLAGAAVHALVGVDVEHAVALINAVDRTLLDAGPVLDVNAWLADDVGHCQPPSLPDSLRASVDLVSPPRIPATTTTPPRQGGRSGQARASGATASYAWHSGACDIRLTDLHD